MTYHDAHNHLCDPRLDPFRERIIEELSAIALKSSVVNSTMEEDWAAISGISRRFPWVIPAFGIHPWYVSRVAEGWQQRFLQHLDAHPNATIGEIGLDRWIPNYDIALQREVFQWQLAVAAERDLPVAVHCLKAWGMLMEILQNQPVPARGFLLHSYSGPGEMVQPLVKLGARFSFSPYFLHERKAAQREVFSRIPKERLLVETDAPEMWPPGNRNLHPLQESGGTQPLNHPANIEVAYAGLSELLGVPLETLAGLVEENFNTFFGR